MIIRREGRGGIQLADSARLLDRLRENYRRSTGRRIEGKTALDAKTIWQRLNAAGPETGEVDTLSGLRATITGDGSAGRYGLLSSPDRLSLYVSDLDAVTGLLEVRPGRVFPNVEMIEATDDTVYFDARKREDGWWASPIQVWLELATGGPRERDAAGTLYTALLSGKIDEGGMP